MDFQFEVLQKIKGELNPHEGACGICHLALMKISEAGGKVFANEAPDGSVSEILDHNGEIIGECVDLVWAPSILAAQLNAGLIP